MYSAPGVARKTTTRATSWAVAARLRGLWARMASPAAPFQEGGGHVGLHEAGRDRGHMIPWGPRAWAIDCPRLFSPALLAP
jgi:hypothetical protein